MAETIILPGAVDMHVHLRDPGYTEAEDFDTGTAAGLGSGVIAMVDMPNNKDNPTITLQALDTKLRLAGSKARTDIGFYFGAEPQPDLTEESEEYDELVNRFASAEELTYGVKFYCDVTTGSEHKHGADSFRKVAKARLEARPNGLTLAHTEGREAVGEMIELVARELGGRIHIPHISKQEELDEVIRAKQDPEIGGRVTTGVCPHHLFMTNYHSQKLGWVARMKPTLGTALDREYLRANIDMIDVVETDHAPHTLAAKEYAQKQNPFADARPGAPTCFGVPGLEAMLPLLLRGEQEGWISRDQIVHMTSTRPAEILGIDLPPSEVHIKPEWFMFGPEHIRSKCGWSPYVGMEMFGKVETVIVGGLKKVIGGQVLTAPGQGRVLKSPYQAPSFRFN